MPTTGRAKKPQPSTGAKPKPIASSPKFLVTLKQIADSADLGRGERTRISLKVAAVQALERIGYHDLTVSEVAKRARVSDATFYLYFKNKTEITVEVLTDFLDNLQSRSESARQEDPFLSIYEANVRLIEAMQANAGLFRCLLQLADETEEFAAVNHRWTYDWYLRVAHSIMRRQGRSALSENSAVFAAYALGGMVDDIMRRLLVHNDAQLNRVSGELFSSHEELAEYLAVIWYRAIYGADPKTTPKSKAAKMLIGSAPR